ncbi:hypothetical protein BC941DRAFT_416159 [Chlamydoabsidia padenii]|nr:hypothetical protein BC941DRAFT_416159 [Chlamydoabsidia padenii]
MNSTNLILFPTTLDQQCFVTRQKRFVDLLKLIDTNLKTKDNTDFKKWQLTIKTLEQLHRNLYENLDTSNQNNVTIKSMIDWVNSLESAYFDYTEAYTIIKDHHHHLLCASVKSIIKNLPTGSPYGTVDGVLTAPFDQLTLCKSVFVDLLNSSNSTIQDNLEYIIQTFDTILQHSPPKMIDTSATTTDLLSFQKMIDCKSVIDLLTGTPLDYQMQPTTGTIILQNDFLLMDSSNDNTTIPVHLVLTSDMLLVCKQLVESTGRYDLIYPPLSVNDIMVQPVMLDRELLGEYTVQFKVLSKSLIARAKSREIRNSWTGMPLTTTAKNAITSNVPLINVVRSIINSNTSVGNSDSTTTLISNHKQDFGSFYENNDISSVDSSEEDDDDDNTSGYDVDSGATNSSTTSSENQHSLVNKKYLPSIPAQPQTPKKDKAVVKDFDTPVINISLHDADVIQVSTGQAQSYNPGFTQKTPSPTIKAKPLPRTSSIRHRPTESSPSSPATKSTILPRTSSIRGRVLANTQSQTSTTANMMQQTQQQQTLQQSSYTQHQSQHHQNRIPGQSAPSVPLHSQHQNVSAIPALMTSSPSRHIQPHSHQYQSPAPVSTHTDKPLPPPATNITTSAQRSMPPTPPFHGNQAFTSTSSQEDSSQTLNPNSPVSSDSFGSPLRLSPEDLVTPPRSPNPYSNEPNGIREVLFSNQHCEVFRWNGKSWYGVDGRCLIEVRQTFTSRSCIAIRVQSTGELYLNAWVLPQTQIRLASPTDVSLELILGQQQETYLVHFNQPSVAAEFDDILQKMRHAATVKQQQPNGDQRSLRGQPSIESIITAQQPGGDNQDVIKMSAHTTESTQGVNSRRSLTRTSSLMQSGQKPTLIPQTLKPVMQCKCKLFVQNEHSNWSGFGSVQLVVSMQIPSRRMHIQIDLDKKRGLSKIIPTVNNKRSSLSSLPPSPSPSAASLPIDDNGIKAEQLPTTANTLVSATVYSNNVERLGSKRISFLLVDQQNRTSSMVYMVYLRDDESGNMLYDHLKIKNAQNGW